MAKPKLKETKPMKKIISISLDEDTIKKVDAARGLATRSKFIESMLMVAEWRCQNREL